MKIIDSTKNKLQSCKYRIQKFKMEHPTIVAFGTFLFGIGGAAIFAKSQYDKGYNEGSHDTVDETMRINGEYFNESRTVNDILNVYRLNNRVEGDYDEVWWSMKDETRDKINGIIDGVHDKIDRR